jgi:hypothetical protein
MMTQERATQECRRNGKGGVIVIFCIQLTNNITPPENQVILQAAFGDFLLAGEGLEFSPNSAGSPTEELTESIFTSQLDGLGDGEKEKALMGPASATEPTAGNLGVSR